MKFRPIPILLILLFTLGLVLGQLPLIRCSDFGKTLFENILGMDGLKCPKIILRKNKNSPKARSPLTTEIIRYNGFSKKTKVPCPTKAVVVLVTGQSNSANHLKSKSYPPNSKTFNYYQGNCFDLSSPTLGATGNRDSIVPAIAAKLKYNLPVIFVTTGWGGTSIRDWNNPSQTNLSEYTNLELTSIEERGGIVRAVIWIQGEADAHTEINYALHFLETRHRITQNLKAPDQIKFLITETSQCFRRIPDPLLTQQQRRLGEAYDFVEVVTNTDSLGQEFRHDTCHFNEAGTEILATKLAQALTKTLTRSTGR